jgi:hypothetical protein
MTYSLITSNGPIERKNKANFEQLINVANNVIEKDNSTAFTPTGDYNPSTKKYVDDGLALKLDTSLKGAANGLAELDANGLIPSAQLPSFVDDVLEYNNSAAFPATGETGKIYVAKDTNITYRWGGSVYVEISSSLALGETSSTAYRGDRGKTAYDHSQITTGNPHGTTKSDIGLGNVSNDAQLKASDLDTDNTLSANSDTKIASQKAVKGYVDGRVSSINSSSNELSSHRVLTDSATLTANDRVVDFNGASGKTITLYAFASIPSGRRYVVEINNFSANTLTVDLGSTTDTVVANESVCYKLDSVGDWSVL